MKHRFLKAWEFNGLVGDMILDDSNGFDLCWEVLEELRNNGDEIPSELFFVLITTSWKAGNAEKAVEIFGKTKDFNCNRDVYTYNQMVFAAKKKINK